jgi:hypothetical protein
MSWRHLLTIAGIVVATLIVLKAVAPAQLKAYTGTN